MGLYRTKVFAQKYLFFKRDSRPPMVSNATFFSAFPDKIGVTPAGILQSGL